MQNFRKPCHGEACSENLETPFHLGLRFYDVDVVLLVVVVQADAISTCEAGEAAQGHLQHCLGVADV